MRHVSNSCKIVLCRRGTYCCPSWKPQNGILAPQAPGKVKEDTATKAPGNVRVVVANPKKITDVRGDAILGGTAAIDAEQVMFTANHRGEWGRERNDNQMMPNEWCFSQCSQFLTGGNKRPTNPGLRTAIRTAARARSGLANDTDDLCE
eukprot:gene21883-biopygen5694